jgi:drug/metabolite transporter (DMT)-like permease
MATAQRLDVARQNGSPAQASSRRRAAVGGISIGVVSAATFGTSGTFGTSLLDAGWTPGTAVLVRITLGALILTIPAVIALRGRWALLRRSWRTTVAYGMFGVVGCQVCYFNALQRMPVGIALLIEYTGAILVVAWLWLRHGHRPRRLTIGGAAAAIAGLALMVAVGGPAQAGAKSAGGIGPVGLAWALAAAVSMAAYFLLSAGPAAPAAGTIDAPGTTGAGDAAGSADSAAARPAALPPIALASAGLWLGAALLALLLAVHAMPYGAGSGDVTLLRHQVSWALPMAGIALISTAVGYSTGIIAARRLGAKLASFIGMSEILFAACYAWALLGQVPSGTQFVGGALILAGVTLVKIDEG